MTNIVSSERPAGDAEAIIKTVRNHILAKEFDSAIEKLAILGDSPETFADVFAYNAVIAYHCRDYAMAIDLLRMAEEQPKSSSDVPEVLAVLYSMAGNLSEALYYGKLGSARKPDNRLLDVLGSDFPSFGEVFTGISQKPFMEQGKRLLRSGDMEGALSWLDQHVRLFPRDDEALALLADVHLSDARPQAASGVLRSLRTLRRDNAEDAVKLGEALTRVGRFSDARVCLEDAARIGPDAIDAHAAYVRHLEHSPHLTTATALDAVAKVRALAAAAAGEEGERAKPSDGKTLRVGYLVGGVMDDNAKRMLAEVASRHDRSRLSVIGYGVGNLSSPRNSVFRNRFDRWTNLQDMDAHTFAAMVGNEGVDLLVDVSGLGDPERLASFALKPAPIQVSWLGAPFAAPGPGFDYRLVDSQLGTEDGDRGAEAWPLDTGLFSFSLPLTPPPAENPSDVRDFLAFGADTELGGLTAEVAGAWSRIMQAVPDSRLLLMDRELSDPASINRLLELFGNFGVAHRIEAVETDDRKEFLREIDVMLATFPFATPYLAADSLAAGVPVVALDKPGRACQDAAHLIKRTGAGDALTADSVDGYVDKAVALAGDADARRAFRGDNWSALSDSVAFSVDVFVRGLEDAFFAMRDKALA